MSSMTLGQVRDWHLEEVRRLNRKQHPFPNNSTVLQALAKYHQEMADAIVAHPLSRDAEVARLQLEIDRRFGIATEMIAARKERDALQSRLAAADALLQRTQMKDYDAAAWLWLGVEIHAHLSENTHDRA